jgi:hypothetical protein
MVELTPLAIAPCESVPLLLAAEQFMDWMVAEALSTGMDKVQPLPPTFNIKVALPALAGIPLIE